MEASRCSRDVALSFRDSCRNASNAARDGYAVLGKRGKDRAPLSIKASSKISDPRHHQQQQCRRHGLLLSPECLSSVQLYIPRPVVRDLPIKWRRNLPCDSQVKRVDSCQSYTTFADIPVIAYALQTQHNGRDAYPALSESLMKW
jgi:hypothetical protein